MLGTRYVMYGYGNFCNLYSFLLLLVDIRWSLIDSNSLLVLVFVTLFPQTLNVTEKIKGFLD